MRRPRRKRLTSKKYFHRKYDVNNSQKPSLCPANASSSFNCCSESTSAAPQPLGGHDVGLQEETQGPLFCVSAVADISSAVDSCTKPAIPLSPLIQTLKKHISKLKTEERKKRHNMGKESGVKSTQGTKGISSPVIFNQHNHQRRASDTMSVASQLALTVKATSPWKVVSLEAENSMERIMETGGAMNSSELNDRNLAAKDTGIPETGNTSNDSADIIVKRDVPRKNADAPSQCAQKSMERIMEAGGSADLSESNVTNLAVQKTSRDEEENACSSTDNRVSSDILNSDVNTLNHCNLKQCKEARSEVVILKAENYLLKLEVEKKEKMLRAAAKRPFSFQDIKDCPEKVSHYTGLPNSDCFYLLLSMVEEVIGQGSELIYFKGWKVVQLSNEQQLFILLLKLRRNYSFEDLGYRFCVSDTTISNIVLTWLHAVHTVLCESLVSEIPSRRKNMSSLPSCFSKFPNCTVILDCTDVSAAMSQSLSNHCKMHNPNKHKVTLKGLVGVAPNGTVTYASKLYPGSTCDKKNVNHCGILQQLQAGDMVMADKGFLIANDLPRGVTLNIPSFLTNPQFTEEEVLLTNSIARSRIHVERAIQKIKRFQIFSFVDRHLFPYASVIFQVCTDLTNLMPALINED